jgi:hypothetical protein
MRISVTGRTRGLIQGFCAFLLLLGGAASQAASLSLVPQSHGAGPYLVDLRVALGAEPPGAGAFTAFSFDLLFDSDVLAAPTFSVTDGLEDSFLVDVLPEACRSPALGCVNVAGVYLLEGPPSGDEFILGSFAFGLLSGVAPDEPRFANLEWFADPLPSPVPEPGTGLLAAAGIVAGLLASRRRRAGA